MSFEATVWGGSNRDTETGAGYGITIPKRIRDKVFNPSWGQIELNLDGYIVKVAIRSSFWKNCNELKSIEIGKWLIKRKATEWVKGRPPILLLIQEQDKRFRVEIKLD